MQSIVVYVAIFCGLSLVWASVTEKFHLMQRHVPRNDFVKVEKSAKSQPHELVFAVKQHNLPELDRMLNERSTPGSSLYQQWLTYSEIGALTKNSAGAQEVLNWLQANEVTTTWVSAREEYITATASIATWEKLLNTEFFLWEDKSRTSGVNRNSRFMHRAIEYSLPETVKPHLSAVFNTVQVPPVFMPKYHKKDAQFRTDMTIERAETTPEAGANAAVDGKVTVAFLNSFYQITTNTGNSQLKQSVFETAEQSYSPTDLTIFQRNFSLPVQAALHPYGYNTTECDFNSCGEGNLDVQYIMGVAQQTTTIYWYVTNNATTDPFVAWLVDVANTTNPPLANSVSWGSLEQANSPDVMDAFNTEAMKLAAMGVTITVSSGDNGVASGQYLCNAKSGSTQSNWPYPSTWTGAGYFPSFPATSPYVTAVGATQGPESGDPEIACQSQLGGVITTGGGFSTYYSQPSWQAAAVSQYFATLPTNHQPSTGYNPNGRGYPDISMIGVWYQIVLQGQMESIFGTSASSPVFAALISLANAARAGEGKPSLGFLNPTLYAYGMNNAFGPDGTNFNPYNDITSGNNKCVAYSGPNPSRAHCCTSGFYANAGWDPVTGFGSINYGNLIEMFDIGIPDPSAEPTAVPTVTPTAPTVNPSAPPTALPTVNPTTEPSAMPTRTPTAPTINPSAAPTAVPTVTATAAPSMRPTAPTMAPSAPPSPIVSFSSNITLTGLTSPVLDAASQNCVVETTAEAMNLPVSAVTYVGTVVLSSVATTTATTTATTITNTATTSAIGAVSAVDSHLRGRVGDGAAAGSAVSEEEKVEVQKVQEEEEEVEEFLMNVMQQHLDLQTTTYSVIAITYTEAVLSETTYGSATDLYTGVTSLLSTSVSSGAFTTQLHANAVLFNTSVLAAADATKETSSPPTIIAASSDSGGGDSLSTGAIVGIAVGCFAFVAILGVFMKLAKYIVAKRLEDANKVTEFSTPTASPTANPVLAGHQVPAQEL